MFAELFEYAQLVSLARYLKDEGVPLLWFLLANKDLIITEDSKGIVEAFARKSEVRQELEIRGGVDLARHVPDGNYVIDSVAAEAFGRELGSTRPGKGATSLVPTQITESPGEGPVAVNTASSLALSSGSGGGGRYQTDAALRVDGAPGLELIRYYAPDVGGADFGPGWHLGVPYEVQPRGDSTVAFLNATIPYRMAVRNPMTGREEVLTFSKEQYAIAGYAPDDLDQSNLIGLFWMTDGSVRLADKVGSEFQFDRSGRLTEMILTDRDATKFQYGLEVVNAESLGSARYRIEPRGSEVVEVRNVRLPRQLELHDQRSGTVAVFAYDEDNKFNVIGYTPVEPGLYSVLALMTDGSFTLRTAQGSEITFDRAGRFQELSRSVVKSLTSRDHRVTFEREYAGDGFRIRKARINTGGGEPLDTIEYYYGTDGRLSQVRAARGSVMDIVYDGSRVATVNR